MRLAAIILAFSCLCSAQVANQQSPSALSKSDLIAKAVTISDSLRDHKQARTAAEKQQLSDDAAVMRAELLRRLGTAVKDDGEGSDADASATQLRILARKYENFDGTKTNCDRRCR